MSHWPMFLALALASLFALAMALQKTLYKSAVCLLGVLIQAAAFFFLSRAPLLAFVQIMIYAGAVMVLLVVTIMASPGSSDRIWAELPMAKPLAAIAFLLLFIEAFLALSGGLPALSALRGQFLDVSAGPILFGPYAVATEAVGFLMLLAALAVVMAEEK